jgi:hypothetical protein
MHFSELSPGFLAGRLGTHREHEQWLAQGWRAA